MSDKKIIIRNCPCFNEGHPMLAYYGECLSLTDDTEVCKDCTDCVMKQIVELCKEVNTKFYDSVHQRYLSPSKAKFARQILELLDIQEVE